MLLHQALGETEERPKVWKKGLAVTVFKEGDLRECNNWRGVTLLPVMSKIFCRMLLERIKKGVKKKRRKKQATFRPDGSITEQIFILRNILEQAYEWRAGLYAHFVDFEKAFDSAHRERKLMEYHEKLWDTSQDGESDSGHIRGL